MPTATTRCNLGIVAALVARRPARPRWRSRIDNVFCSICRMASLAILFCHADSMCGRTEVSWHNIGVRNADFLPCSN